MKPNFSPTLKTAKSRRQISIAVAALIAGPFYYFVYPGGGTLEQALAIPYWITMAFLMESLWERIGW